MLQIVSFAVVMLYNYYLYTHYLVCTVGTLTSGGLGAVDRQLLAVLVVSLR